MLSFNSCISDLVILWLDSCGVNKIIGCWLPSYKKSLLSVGVPLGWMFSVWGEEVVSVRPFQQFGLGVWFCKIVSL